MTVARLSVLLLCVAHLGAQPSGRINGVIDKLQQGEPVFGIFSEDRSPTNAAALNDSALDFIIIDMEHRPLDFESLRQFLQGMLSRNDHTSSNPLRPPALPLVRLPQNGSEQLQFLIKQALDVGAYGLVLPHIESREQALSAVRAARYFQKSGASDFDPPGLRGVSPAVAARYWGLSIDEYMEKADLWPLDPSGEVLLIMLIESREGAENIDAILEAPGIGGIFIGTWDLATSLGFPRDSEAPQVTEAIAKILAASKRAGIPCGITTTINTVDQHLNQGFRILTVGSDVGVSPAAAVVLEHLQDRGR
ncbi:MAG: aldolase/citrate lyase family protein [Acidobacteria bacterium]|nr:aldolase/citrate lyase family protein [Acidobacteriota bacterium]